VDDEIRREREQLHSLERKLAEREDRVAQKLEALEQKALRLQERVAEVNAKEVALTDERLQLQRKLEEVASLTTQEAAARVLALAEEGTKADVVRRVRKLEAEAQEDLEKKSHLLLASVVQRYAAPHAATTAKCPHSNPAPAVVGV
jgi:ribonuclease Y